MTFEFHKKVCIIGGGVTGLSAAFFLKWLTHGKLPFCLLEATPHVGGTIRTIREQGYQVETGPNGFLTNRPTTWELIDALRLGSRVMFANEKSNAKFVYCRGKLRRVPTDPLRFLFSGLLSPQAKLRLFAEPLVRSGKDVADESVASFLKRRLGNEPVDHLADPALSGIYAGDTNELSAAAIFPKLVSLEQTYGSLVAGYFAGRKKKALENSEGKVKKQRTRLASFQNGMSELIDALGNELNGEIETGCHVTALEFDKNAQTYTVRFEHEGSRSHIVHAEHVLLALPAYAAAAITQSLGEVLSPLLETFPYAPVHIVALGFPERAFEHARKLNGFGFLIAKEDRHELLGVIHSSLVFSGRAPRGKILLRCMLGGATRPELAHVEADELVRMTRMHLHKILDLRSSPEFVKIFRWPRAIPQYTLGHVERLVCLKTELKNFPGLLIAGNAFGGISMNDCIEQGKLLAQAIAKDASRENRPELVAQS